MRQQMLKNGRISGESRVYFLLREKKTRDSSTTQGKTVMKMTSEAFRTWSQRLRLSSETEALIIAIRSSPPVRRVSGRANNITGRYPSPKMGMSIQFESDRGAFTDLSATLLMRHEHVTLYAQETQIPKVHQREPVALVAPIPDAPLASLSPTLLHRG